MSQNQPKTQLSSSKLDAITHDLMEQFEELLIKLDVPFHQNSKAFKGACPIHGGDNEGAWAMYKDTGTWGCYTHNCHAKYKKSPIGFIQGVLSTKRGAEVSFGETVRFIENFLNKKYDDLVEQLTPEEANKRTFIKQINALNQIQFAHGGKITRSAVRRSLKIPAEYYLNRKYKAETLDFFDVGLSINKNSDVVGRIVVPFYDEQELLVGYTSRTTEPICLACKCFHKHGARCPENGDKFYHSKWRHQTGFPVDKYFYNLWNASQHIASSGIVFLVEGPGDVWRLHEAGIKNALAYMGSFLKEGQKTLLDTTGATTIVVPADNDAAGLEGFESIKKQCKKDYQVIKVGLNAHDVGDTEPAALRELLRNYI